MRCDICGQKECCGAELQHELAAARDEIEALKAGQVKTDNSQTLVNALEEIEALKLANRDLQHWFDDARDEVERLRGRVSELERLEELLPDIKRLLKEHRYCGDQYPESGWPEEVALVAKLQRLRTQANELEAGGGDE